MMCCGRHPRPEDQLPGTADVNAPYVECKHHQGTSESFGPIPTTSPLAHSMKFGWVKSLGQIWGKWRLFTRFFDGMEEVVGSIPTRSTIQSLYFEMFGRH